ncbi:DUF6343 family protein [Streptomyces sp. ZAF1911]|uniref:DUF6343 family protein n=1 Tax=Streptomyces sp. ZAF1911 TaxID=2944129 RepID=UPI00237C4C46|nr:DUF6343 family protein [Streptomyces sp. ZAF1911]MDD9375683.1 DUF6343 family protein [Streptomyces sp. ZAF1911]
MLTTARRRDGTEAGRARSGLRLRRLVSTILAPVFTAGGVVFALAGLRATQGSSPSAGLCAVLSAACLVLAAVAITDLYVIRRRLRGRQPHQHGRAVDRVRIRRSADRG